MSYGVHRRECKTMSARASSQMISGNTTFLCYVMRLSGIRIQLRRAPVLTNRRKLIGCRCHQILCVARIIDTSPVKAARTAVNCASRGKPSHTRSYKPPETPPPSVFVSYAIATTALSAFLFFKCPPIRSSEAHRSSCEFQVFPLRQSISTHVR